MRALEGAAAEGSILTARLEPPGGRAMTIKPKLIAFREDQELRWRGHLLVPGLFDGEHKFRLEAVGAGRTRFLHGEQFSGLLAGPMLRVIGERTRRGFEAMNQALKQRVEERTGG